MFASLYFTGSMQTLSLDASGPALPPRPNGIGAGIGAVSDTGTLTILALEQVATSFRATTGIAERC
jgi:hypothetical protein